MALISRWAYQGFWNTYRKYCSHKDIEISCYWEEGHIELGWFMLMKAQSPQ
jgi:hypothetical protein